MEYIMNKIASAVEYDTNVDFDNDIADFIRCVFLKGVIMRDKFIKELENMRACPEALLWVKGQDLSPRELWESCEEPAWLMWLLFKKRYGDWWPTERSVLSLLCDLVEGFALKPLESLKKEYHPTYHTLKNGLNCVHEFLQGNVSRTSLAEADAIIQEIIRPSDMPRIVATGGTCTVSDRLRLSVTEAVLETIRVTEGFGKSAGRTDLVSNAVFDTVDAAAFGECLNVDTSRDAVLNSRIHTSVEFYKSKIIKVIRVNMKVPLL